MKQTLTLLILLIQIFASEAQELLNLSPSYVHPLDFSDKAKAEWAKRDSLLSQLSSNKKTWENLSKDEEAILEKYGEIFEDIWDIVGGACSWYCAGGPEEVTASSYLKAQSKNSYVAQNAHDLSYKNAWVEGVKGYGIGESLTYKFHPASPRVTDIIIVNGYVKSKSAWRNNSRVKKLKLYVNDKPYAILNLQDQIAEQGFKVKPIGNNDREDMDKLQKKAKWTLKFEILEVYKGAKYDDTAISEIYFDGLDVHCFAKGTPILMADKTTKNIEDIRKGDIVAYKDLVDYKIKTTEVEQIEMAIHNKLVTFLFKSGRKITATQDHPFYLQTKGWASLRPEKSASYKGFENIQSIQVGDKFLTFSGTDELIEIVVQNTAQETFTISKLSTGGNFIANGFIVGVEELNQTIVETH